MSFFKIRFRSGGVFDYKEGIMKKENGRENLRGVGRNDIGRDHEKIYGFKV